LSYFADDSEEEGFFDALSVKEDISSTTYRKLRVKNVKIKILE